jgi:hypothetical protein
MNLKLITDDGDEPLCVADVTGQLHYTIGDQDAYIGGLITAARIMAEIWNGRQQTIKSWDLALDHWPGVPMFDATSVPNPYFGFWPSDAYRMLNNRTPGLNAISLLAPLVSVEAVTWTDVNGNVTTMVPGVDYIVDTWKEPGIVLPAPNAQWPAVSLWPSSAIHVKFTAGRVPDAAGYAAANPTLPPAPEVPRNIKQGMMLLVNQWFTDRVPYDSIRFVAEPPFAANTLFTANKLWV